MATHVQDVCEKCSSRRVYRTQIILSVFGVCFTILVLFLVGWRHVFLEKERWGKANSQGKRENFVHYYYDKVMEKFIGFCVRCWRAIDRMFQNGNGVYESSLKRGDHVKIRATGELGVVSGFKVTHSWQFICVKLNNSGVKKDYVRNNLEKISNLSLQNHQWKLIIQLGKIFFANVQVISTFIDFKVPQLPPALQASIRTLSNLDNILIFDITVFPAMGCLTGDLGFFERVLLRTLLPLLITFLMVVPVLVAWRQVSRLRLALTRSETPQERLKADLEEAINNLEKTKHACWSNVLGWLFLVFPSAALASMQAFGCRKIQNVQYLVADLRETCPREWTDGTLHWSIILTSIWTLGTLGVFGGSMYFYNVPAMTALKRKHVIINAMIGTYRLKNADSGQQTQFTGTEKAGKWTLRQLFALLTFKWERRSKQIAEEDEWGAHLEDQFLQDAQDQAHETVQEAIEDELRQSDGDTSCFNSDNANTHSSEEESVLREVQQLYRELELELEIRYQLIEDADQSRIIDWPKLFHDLSNLSTSDFADRVTALEDRTRTDVLLPQVEQLGIELTEEEIIAVPKLKWDGTGGDEEKRMLQSLGFLLDAYQVNSWSWELVEIARKLILTAILVVWFDGSEEHLTGSLLTTFVFIVLHLVRRPYLNTGLNNFQTLALITQFLTIFTLIIFLNVDCLNQLHEAQPDSDTKTVAEFWSWVIIVINWLTAILYPAYSIYLLLTDSKTSFSSTTKSCLIRLYRYCKNPHHPTGMDSIVVDSQTSSTHTQGPDPPAASSANLAEEHENQQSNRIGPAVDGSVTGEIVCAL